MIELKTGAKETKTSVDALLGTLRPLRVFAPFVESQQPFNFWKIFNQYGNFEKLCKFLKNLIKYSKITKIFKKIWKNI